MHVAPQNRRVPIRQRHRRSRQRRRPEYFEFRVYLAALANYSRIRRCPGIMCGRSTPAAANRTLFSRSFHVPSVQMINVTKCIIVSEKFSAQRRPPVKNNTVSGLTARSNNRPNHKCETNRNVRIPLFKVRGYTQFSERCNNTLENLKTKNRGFSYSFKCKRKSRPEDCAETSDRFYSTFDMFRAGIAVFQS